MAFSSNVTLHPVTLRDQVNVLSMRWILLPGFDGTGMLFTSFIQSLPTEITPIIVKYPTDQISSESDLINIVLAHLPENEPYILIAESFSGPIALRVAALHHQPPLAVVLCASFLKCPAPRLLIKIIRFFARFLVLCSPPKCLVRYFLLGDASEDLLTSFYDAISTVNPRVLEHRLSVLQSFNDEGTMYTKHPLLYLWAIKDRLISFRNVSYLQRRYPAALVEKIESPHLILQVEPHASIQAIRKFLAQLQ